MFEKIRRHFFVGVFTVAPFALTIYVIILLGGWFDALFQPLIHLAQKSYVETPVRVPGLGIALGILVIVGIGIVAPSFLGKYLVKVTERIVERIPLAKVIYSASRQIFNAFSASNEQRFSRVVMVPFPIQGSWSIGFVTREFKQQVIETDSKAKLAVFVPTTPNPTSGWLMFVDPNETVPLPVSVEDGLKLVISGALAVPPSLEKSL